MAKGPSKVCEDRHCDQEPRMAIKTARTADRNIRTTVYFDDRGAPVSASRYCKNHGTAILIDLSRTLVSDDFPPQGD